MLDNSNRLAASHGGHVPKTAIKTRHKVIRFGTLRRASSPEEEVLYNFVHQRADLKVTKGSIPVGFLSSIQLEEGNPLFLETRAGRAGSGPEYMVQHKLQREVILTGPGDGWNPSLDDLWTGVLSHFERKSMLSEETLEYLDADPFVLFGIDDDITQQALVKLQKFPSLMCEGAAPTQEEWSYYLRVEPDDRELQWLVQAMSETELPKPWTCYKGVGSIVCFIRSDIGQVTWKHPFYDYFRQLRDFCVQASVDEVRQVRVNRLLWSYEASRVETDTYQEPLVSPEYIEKLSDIFGYNVKEEGFLVRNLKAQLKVFARTYHERQEIDMGDIGACADTLQRDAEKYVEMCKTWDVNNMDDVTFQLKELSNGEIRCVNCETVALCFCLECKDYLCLDCYDNLHRHGARRDHAPFRLVACALCTTMPAKLECTFTDRSLCHECYAMKHIKVLPPDGKENQPRQINYKQQYLRYAQYAADRKKDLGSTQQAIAPEEESYESVLSTDWHPFYDSRGVKYYHNFSTSERMRQSPRRVPNTADPGAMDTGDCSALFSDDGSAAEQRTQAAFQLAPLELSGFDSLETAVPAAIMAARQPELRSLRAPHRVHMPCQVPAA